MIKLFSVLFTVLTCLSATGCDSDNATVPEEPVVALRAVYDLPEGWTWLDEENGVAIWEHRSKDGGSPFVKFTPLEFPIGTEEEAKADILENYNYIHCDRGQSPDQECDRNPEYYKEFVFDDTTVYASMSTGSVWGMESWTSVLGFEHDGRKAIFILYDKADLHMEELEQIISTLKFVER